MAAHAAQLPIYMYNVMPTSSACHLAVVHDMNPARNIENCVDAQP